MNGTIAAPVPLAQGRGGSRIGSWLRDVWVLTRRNLITIGVWLPLALVPAWALDGRGTSDAVRLGDERSGVRRRRWHLDLPARDD